MIPSIQIYADGADLKTMAALADRCDGATTNPSLMRKAGITDYRKFAREVLAIWQGKPVSFEALADDWRTINKQAREISSWGDNVYVKLPVTNGTGQSCVDAIRFLEPDGVKFNITAVFTVAQANAALNAMHMRGHIISVFAGRIADSGASAKHIVRTVADLARLSGVKALWASTRQAYSVIEAEQAGADIITMTPDLIAKMDGFGRDLDQYSLETVRQFALDAEGITL